MVCWARMRFFLRETIATIFLALLLYLTLRLGVDNFCIRGASMHPTLSTQQCLFVNKLTHKVWDLKRGEIAVFHEPGGGNTDVVKRVIGLPGDVVAFQQGIVLLNGRALGEPYVKGDRGGTTRAPVRIPPGHVYVLGDNRFSSRDSRAWGPIPASSVIGRAWVRYWPVHKFKFIRLQAPISEEPVPRPAAARGAP